MSGKHNSSGCWGVVDMANDFVVIGTECGPTRFWGHRSGTYRPWGAMGLLQNNGGKILSPRCPSRFTTLCPPRHATLPDCKASHEPVTRFGEVGGKTVGRAVPTTVAIVPLSLGMGVPGWDVENSHAKNHLLQFCDSSLTGRLRHWEGSRADGKTGGCLITLPPIICRPWGCPLFSSP